MPDSMREAQAREIAEGIVDGWIKSNPRERLMRATFPNDIVAALLEFPALAVGKELEGWRSLGALLSERDPMSNTVGDTWSGAMALLRGVLTANQEMRDGLHATSRPVEPTTELNKLVDLIRDADTHGDAYAILAAAIAVSRPRTQPAAPAPTPRMKKDEYVEKVVGWALDANTAHWPGLADEARDRGGMDGVYEGKSTKLHRLALLGYLRGLRDGARYAWEARQPVVLRTEGADA